MKKQYIRHIIMDLFQKNKIFIAIIIGALIISASIYLSYQQKAKKGNDLDFVLELRDDCKKEYNDIVKTMETWAKSDLEGGLLFGRESGVLDENNFVREQEEWLKECIDKKASVWQ